MIPETTIYYLNDNGEVFANGPTGYIDEHGNPVERTPHTHPYNYDSFVMWRGLPNKGADGSIYSDRLYQWDWEKDNKLCKKHFGDEAQYWDNRDPEAIEAFLRDWCEDEKLKLHYIMQCCNQSTGYPCWCFVFHHSTEKDWTIRDVANIISKEFIEMIGDS